MIEIKEFMIRSIFKNSVKMNNFLCMIPGTVYWKRSRARKMIRGYRKLRAEGSLHKIQDLKESLTKTDLLIPQKKFSKLIFGSSLPSAEIVVRQYLLLNVGFLNLNNAILIAQNKKNRKVIAAIPKQWHDSFAKNNLYLNGVACALLWHLTIFCFTLYGILKIFQTLCETFISLKRKKLIKEKYVYFSNLSLSNLPNIKNFEQSFDIISWYLQWTGRNKHIKNIHHDVNNTNEYSIKNVILRFQPNPVPPLRGLSMIARYLLWTLQVIFLVLFDMLRGRWWHGLLLNQSALSNKARLLSIEDFASEYYFHNSSWLYRPLWTYEAEKGGSKITMYFYSTNCQSFKRGDGDNPIFIGYNSMSWTNYLVWDSYQADFIRKCVGSSVSIDIVGPIWFQSGTENISNDHVPFIAVFDVTPFRVLRYCQHALAEEYYVPDVVNKFLEDIIDIVGANNRNVGWKIKRNIGKSAHPRYRKLSDQLREESRVIVIGADQSARSVIELADAVISMPFTSTALIARELGKPSIYYDPSGLIFKDDPAAHGIPLINSIVELNSWIRKISEITYQID